MLGIERIVCVLPVCRTVSIAQHLFLRIPFTPIEIRFLSFDFILFHSFCFILFSVRPQPATVNSLYLN